MYFKSFKSFIAEETTTIFDINTANIVAKRLESNLKVPFVIAKVSSLGGKENVSILLNISLDPKEEWGNGIYQNSNFMQFHISNSGIIDRFTAHYTLYKDPFKFRKLELRV